MTGKITYIKERSTFLSLFNQWTWRVMVIAAIIQVAVFFSWENVFASLISLIAWKLTELFVMRKAILERFTMSAIIILGFSVTQYLLPLVFTLLEGKPLVYNLDLPYLVFYHSLLAILVMLLAHRLYRLLQQGNNVLRNKVQLLMARANFFKPPTNMQIWILGFVGLLGMAATYFTGGRYEVADEDRGTLAKVLQGLIPFAYAPFFLLMSSLYNPALRLRQAAVWKVVLFTLAVILIGIGGNSRGLFMTGITTAGIAYFLGLLLGKFSYRIFTLKNVLLGGIGFFILTGPLSDLGTAMVVVRSQRNDISASELLSRTVAVYGNKDELRLYKRTALQESPSDWDEHYFDNIFLSRFCNLKYNDEGLKQSEKIGKVDDKMQDYSANKLWAILPQPILSALSVNVNKEETISSSFGDYLFLRAGGVNALGGFRTGQFASTGMAAFGWWYLLLLGIGIIPLFFLLDLFVLVLKAKDRRQRVVLISFAGLMPLTSFFMFMSLSTNSESVINIYSYLLRGWIQLMILYWIVYLGAAKLSLLMKR